MKKSHLLFCAFSCAFLLASCKSDKNEMIEPETINYTFNGFNVESGSISELSTRAEANYNLLAVDVKDGSYVQSISRVQQPMSEALADVTLPLKVGSHKIYILCSSQPWHSFNESSLLVTWNDQTAPLADTWSTVVNVNVQAGNAQTKSVTLNRVVALVRTVIADALPDNLAKFRQSLVGGSWCFNLAQQSGDVASQITRISPVSSSYAGRTGVGISLYTFVPAGATSAASYSLTALDTNDQSIQSISFNNVPLEVNRYTTYQGNYFGYDNTFTVTLQTDWGDAVVIPF